MRSTKTDRRRASSTPSAAPRGGRVRVRLHYTFDVEEQVGDALANPVIEILTAVLQAGSIRHAAHLLGRSYRHVWGQLRHWERVFGEPLINWSQGQRSRLTVFAEQLLRADRRARSHARPHIETLRADLAGVVTETQQDRSRLIVMHASHDLGLPLLRQYLAQYEGLQMDLEFLGSLTALQSLRDRRCLTAGFHAPLPSVAPPGYLSALRPYLDPALHRAIPCSQRTQGLMMRREYAVRVRSMADVAAQKLRFVNRQVGSGTRLLVEHLLQSASLNASDVPGFVDHVESSHLSAALCIAGGVADVGVGLEAAALHYGLHFAPLIRETYYLACRADDVDHPAIKRLRKTLAGSAWRAMLATMPGYATPDSLGEVCSVNEIVPQATTVES